MRVDRQYLVRLKNLMDELGMSQKDVSIGTSISRPHLSMSFKKNKDMSEEKWKNVFEFLQAVVSKYRHVLSEGDEGSEHWANAYKIGGKPLSNLELELSNLKFAFFKSDETKKKAKPGELITSEAINHVGMASSGDQRPLVKEEELHLAVREQKYFTILISGPLRNGRSSLIARLSATAKKAGHRVIHVGYASSHLVNAEKIELRDLYELLFSESAFQFDPSLGRLGWGTSFKAQAESGWADGKTITLIIDGLEALATSDDRSDTILEFFHWLNSLRYFTPEPPFSQFQIIALHTPFSEDAYKASKFHSQAGQHNQLLPFCPDRCAQLAQSIGIPSSAKVADDAYRLFLGQPYLTHYFLENVYQEKERRNDACWSELVETERGRSLECAGAYRVYIDRVVSHLELAGLSVSSLFRELLGEPDKMEEHSLNTLRLSGALVLSADDTLVTPPFMRSAIELYLNSWSN